MKLFLCEKPSQAQDLAKELQAFNRNNGYLSNANNSIVVTWAVGHLVEQASPEEYDSAYKQWRLDTLPIIPKHWIVKPKIEVKKQYNAVMGLIKKASEVIISTDADREGEMIARELLVLAKFKGQVSRCWLTALDSESIRKALKSLKQGNETESLYFAALARSRSDWLIGMNFSRLFTLLAKQQGFQGVLSVGRVQSPTLAMVVNRDREIKNFTPKSHYVLSIDLINASHQSFKAIWQVPRDYLDEAGLCLNKNIIEYVQKQIIQKQVAQVDKIETKREKNAPPLLFSLSDLQSECNRLFGLGAQKVLDIAQSLYEKHKATTYPRTDCGYLPESQLSEAKQIIQCLVKSDERLQKIVPHLNFSQKSRAWNDKKITAHHGIIPTKKEVDLSAFSTNELNVYGLICKRYLAQFLPHYEVDKTVVNLVSGNCVLTAKGKQVINFGWRILFGKDKVESEDNRADNAKYDENIEEQNLPKLERGEICTVKNTDIKSLKTSPLSHFTEGTLLSAMKNAARFVTDERLKQRLRETEGLGTEATRAGLIQGLIDRGFLSKKGKQILATEQANTLIDNLPDMLKNPGLTALWEQALNQIAEGTLPLNEFMVKQEAFIKHLMQTSLNQGLNLGNIKIKKCPKCQAPMVQRTSKKTSVKFWACSRYPECDGVEFIDSGSKKKTRKKAM